MHRELQGLILCTPSVATLDRALQKLHVSDHIKELRVMGGSHGDSGVRGDKTWINTSIRFVQRKYQI